MVGNPWFRVAGHLLAGLPMVLGFWQVYLTLQGTPTEISTDPGAVLADKTGFWAVNLLLVTLSMTPLQKWTRKPFVVHRRALGLWAFAYAALHVFVFYSLILDGDLSVFGRELVRRPYIVLGALAVIVLVALAVTSNEYSMRRLRKRWKALHKWVYVAAVLAIVHQLWQVKSFEMIAVIHAVVLAFLLGVRFRWYLARRARL